MGENIDMADLIATANGHPDSEARRYAVYLLGMIGDSSAAGGLLSAIRDKDKRVRAQAVLALPLLGDKVVVPVCALLMDAEWRVRYRAAEALGILRSPAAESPLVGALSDEKDHVRYMAAKAIGGIGGVAAVNALIPLLMDQNEFVRRSAAVSLGQIGDPAACQPLIDAVAREKQEGIRRELAGVIATLQKNKNNS
jgi:HEAT repeat protein